jgi:hypothetical protein
MMLHTDVGPVPASYPFNVCKVEICDAKLTASARNVVEDDIEEDGHYVPYMSGRTVQGSADTQRLPRRPREG